MDYEQHDTRQPVTLSGRAIVAAWVLIHLPAAVYLAMNAEQAWWMASHRQWVWPVVSNHWPWLLCVLAAYLALTAVSAMTLRPAANIRSRQ
jgi:hypothetical protein